MGCEINRFGSSSCDSGKDCLRCNEDVLPFINPIDSAFITNNSTFQKEPKIKLLQGQFKEAMQYEEYGRIGRSQWRWDGEQERSKGERT